MVVRVREPTLEELKAMDLKEFKTFCLKRLERLGLYQPQKQEA